MKKPKKINPLFLDLLKNYFSFDDINEFENEQLNNLAETKQNFPEKKNGLRKLNLPEIPLLRSETDLLITFADIKLERNKYLEFLLSLGQMITTAGEFALAIDIYEKLLIETKNKKEYINIYANAFLSLGEMNSRQARWQLSFNNIKKSGNIFLKQKDSYGEAKCENLLGTIYGEIGDLKKAKKFFMKSLSLVENNKDSSLKGAIEINLGIINNIQGNYDLAITYFQRALVNFLKVNHLKRVAEIKHNIGMTYLKLNKYDLSLHNFDESVNTAAQIGSFATLGITYVSKAYLFTLKKDFNLAEAFADMAMEICNKTNDRLSIADIYKIKGIIHRNKSNYKSSEKYLLTSLRINKELGNNLNFAETNFELGLLYKTIGRTKESKVHFNDAIKYFKGIKALNELKIIQDAAGFIN